MLLHCATVAQSNPRSSGLVKRDVMYTKLPGISLMSSIDLLIFVKPENDESATKIRNFIVLVNEKKYSEITKLDSEGFLGNKKDIKRYFDSNIEATTRKEAIRIQFDTFNSFDYAEFVVFLGFLGAEEIEMSIFNSQVGEYTFVKNDTEFANYKDVQWRWVNNPCPSPRVAVRISAYEFNFGVSDDWKEILADDIAIELFPMFRKHGYIGESWYADQIEHNPKGRTLEEKYGSLKKIPKAELEPFDPKRVYDVADIIQCSGTLLFLQSPHTFEAESGYDHALILFANSVGLKLNNISYIKKQNTKSTYILSCEYEGKKLSADLIYSEYTWPKNFLLLIYKITQRSAEWDFIFFTQDDNPTYTIMNHELCECLERHEFLRKIDSWP